MKAGCGGMIVTVADALSVESSLWIAVTLTVDGFGAIAGALYNPSALTVPTVESPPGRSFTAHRTLVVAVPASSAWNCCVRFTKTDAVLGVTVSSPSTRNTAWEGALPSGAAPVIVPVPAPPGTAGRRPCG